MRSRQMAVQRRCNARPLSRPAARSGDIDEEETLRTPAARSRRIDRQRTPNAIRDVLTTPDCSAESLDANVLSLRLPGFIACAVGVSSDRLAAAPRSGPSIAKDGQARDA